MVKKAIEAKAYALPSAKAPKVVKEAEAKRFEEGAAASRRRAEKGERVTLYLPPELAKKVRLLCVEERRSMSDAATEALTQWVARR